MDIAKYIINKGTEMNDPVSNLKLQYVLYFSWKEFYNMTGKELFGKFFDESVCAWDIGPVVPTVYYEYCQYSDSPIRLTYPVEIHGEDKVILDDILSRYLPMHVKVMSDTLKAPGSAWSAIYRNGKGDGHFISFRTIIEKET